MRIERDQVIAGFPARRVRDALKKSIRQDGLCFVGILQHAAGLSEAEAIVLVRDLVELGFVEPIEAPFGRLEPGWYRATISGAALSMASARPPTKRAVAQARLQELLERVAALNADDQWCDYVDTVLMFGSVLDDSVIEVGDVDLAIAFSLRRDVGEAELARRAEALRGDRRFSSYVDWLLYPSVSARRFIKARSPLFSITDLSDGVLRLVDWQELYHRPGTPPLDPNKVGTTA